MLPKKYQRFISLMINYCQGFDEETGGKDYRLYHQLRVACVAYRLSRQYKANKVNEKIVVIGGLFHDVGRIHILKQNNSKVLRFKRKELDKHKQHDKLSKKVLSGLLKEELTNKEIGQVNEAINKSLEHHLRSIENKILYDADFLDELGVLNLFRMFTYSGIINRSISDTVDYWFNTDREIKISKIEKCFTDVAKKEAKRRVLLQDRIMMELKNNGFKY